MADAATATATGPERHDFDNPWKEALHEFFPSFLEFFFPAIHADIDWSRGYRFLDAELRQLARRARTGRRLPDALVRVVRRNGREGYILVHVEIQAQVDRGFKLRVAIYHNRIFDVHRLPLVSLVILADPHPGWRPNRYERELWGTRSVVEFCAFKLLDLKEKRSELVDSPNPFALLSVAHLAALEAGPGTRERLAWKLRLVRGLYRQGLDGERVRSLLGLVDWVLHLTPGLEDEFCREVEEFERSKGMGYITSFERRGLEKGRQEGRQEGLERGRLEASRRSVCKVLRARFSEVPAAVSIRLDRLSDCEDLDRLLDEALACPNLAAFEEALEREAPRD